jgi:glutathione S-transferase
MKVYGMSRSGNCHKVRLLFTQLDREFEWAEVDVMGGGTRTPEYLTMNPNGRVPLLEIEPGRWLPESDAILWYLAEGTPFLTDDRWQRAQTLQWMFFEQYSHEPYVAVARFIDEFLPPDHARRAELPELRRRGYLAFDCMEHELAARPFFVGDRYSIADIALHAYTDVAEEGGFDLARYPAVNAWRARVRAQPRYVAMPG